MTNPVDVIAAALLVAYTLFRIARPIEKQANGRSAQLQIWAELALCVVALSISGAWRSPFVLIPIPAVMLAGYGWGYRQGIAAAAVTAGSLTVVDVLATSGSRSVAQGAQAALMLGLCASIGAFTRSLFLDEEAQHRRDQDQITRMSTANDLLSALHEVVQTLPDSLDLGEVVASTQRRLREHFDYTSATFIIRDGTTDLWRVELAEGVRLETVIAEKDLPSSAIEALACQDTLRSGDLAGDDLEGFAPGTGSVLAAPLRARNTVVGLVEIEHREPNRFSADDAEMLIGMSGPLALAVDNAMWFGRLRTLGAEAERARIARDLHDRLAQSLAYVSFELERLAKTYVDDSDLDTDLDALHDVVRGVVVELRETLYQLRADVTDSLELEKVARAYLQRFQDRTGIACTLTARARGRRLPIQVEQEVWRILQEALTNVERHADARRVWVSWTTSADRASLEVRDDGRGFRPSTVDDERYGLTGMRERAAAIGAQLSIDSQPDFGTRILVELEVPR
ncbi:MAG TPA: GAF domain-containing sensor histidine kinase [Acidimicrobiia bacterium]|nr:GAF domain-containing sensor histidine kinase [Acidimicrobiia bacterium]